MNPTEPETTRFQSTARPGSASVPALNPIGTITATAIGGPPPYHSERPASLSAGPDAMGLLKAFRRCWQMAVGGGLVASALVAVAAYMLVPQSQFVARSLLHVSSLPPRVIFKTGENFSDYRTYQRTQVTLAKSRQVLQTALRDPEVAKLEVVGQQPDPVAWLDREMKIDFPGNSEILVISMSGARPRDLMLMVNAVTDAYMKKIVLEEQRERTARWDQLKRLFDQFQDDLKEKRKTYRELAETVGSNDRQSVALKQQMASEHMAFARQNLMQLQQDLRKSQATWKRAVSLGGAATIAPDPESLIEEEIARDPQLADYERTLEKQKTQLESARRLTRAKNTDPSVRKWSDAVAATQQTIAKRRARLHGDLVARMEREGKNVAKSPVDESREYTDFLAMQEKQLKEEVETLDKDMRSFNVKSMDLHWIEDEIELANAAAKTVGQEVEALNVETKAPPRIRLIEKAELPTIVDKSRRIKISGLAGILALGLFVGGLSYWEFSTRRVETAEEVVQGLGMRLMGALPAPPRRISKAPREVWQNLLIESIDATRLALLHAARIEGVRTVMVTSALKGEGKTTLSCHLATSLARAGQRTLLVDCDLRSPSVHGIIETSPSPGICEYLRGQASLGEILQSTLASELTVIAAGVCDPQALQALARDGLRRMFDTVRGDFDFIIIDTAPALLVTDSLIVSQYADAVLFSILREVSRSPKVFAAYERLSTVGARIMGAVIAGTRSENSGYGYGYGYGYGHSDRPRGAQEAGPKGDDHVG